MKVGKIMVTITFIDYCKSFANTKSEDNQGKRNFKVIYKLGSYQSQGKSMKLQHPDEITSFFKFKHGLNDVALEDFDIGHSAVELMPCHIDVSCIITLNFNLHEFPFVSLQPQKQNDLLNLVNV
jgi:hypothetical protein